MYKMKQSGIGGGKVENSWNKLDQAGTSRVKLQQARTVWNSLEQAGTRGMKSEKVGTSWNSMEQGRTTLTRQCFDFRAERNTDQVHTALPRMTIR